MDTEAIAWAAQKLQAFAVDNSTMDNALMMDRLYAMLAAPTPPAQHGPDFPDGCDSEGFSGGCERFGHTPETCPNAQEYSCPCGLGDKPCPDPATRKPLCAGTPAQEDEPVAYIERGNGQLWPKFEADQMLSDDMISRLLTPLYTCPSDDKLRKAAEEYSALTEMANLHFQSEEHAQQHLDAKWKLRAALNKGKA